MADCSGCWPANGISRLTLHHEALIWATVGINIAGSFLLGLVVAEPWFSRDVREALGVGFLGGFTTFSTFSVQVVLGVEAGEPGRAALYPAASVLGGIAAAAAGFSPGRVLRQDCGTRRRNFSRARAIFGGP